MDAIGDVAVGYSSSGAQTGQYPGLRYTTRLWSDPASTLRIEELMSELRRQYTIVLVTHNMYQASRVSQRTGFFLQGELIEMGPTEQIFERPADSRTDDYIRGRFG